MSTLPAAKHHSGFTLVEMLIVIGTTSMICALATSLIVTMFRAEQGQTYDADERRAIGRLGNQFRTDVHAAEAVAGFTEEKDVLLRLPLGSNGEVTYRRTDTNIVREVHRGGTVARHDTFGVSDRWQVAIARDTTGDLLQLSLARTPAANQPRAPHHWQFAAAWGSDHRHNSGANETEQ